MFVIEDLIVIIDKDGNSYRFGNLLEQGTHECLQDYFGDDKKNKMEIIYELNMNGEIVYLNAGYFGVLYLGDEINEKQISVLYKLCDEIGDQLVGLNYDPEDLGFIHYKTLAAEEGMSLKEQVDEYLGMHEERHPTK